ncbi:MAG: glycosyltransferase family 4 protein [Candidatus Brocadia sp.]|nr:glycosyltransferase family 4 protein [Candidatus Brocadia sp.]
MYQIYNFAMKIALVVYQFIKEKGGVESYVWNASRQLLGYGYEVHIFAHRFSQDQDKRLFFHHVPAFTFWSPLRYWTFAVNAPKIIKKSEIAFDLIHGFTQTLSQDIYRVGGGCHWDYMMHTYPLMQSRLGKMLMCLNPRHFSLLLLEKIILQKKCYKRITCISEQCKKELIRHYHLSPDDIEIIYNGVDIRVFTPHNRRTYRDTVRAQYAIAPDDVLVLFVGSGFKRKGLRHAIIALSLMDTSQKVKVLVVGKGNIREYQRFAQKKGVLDKLFFAGVCKHIHEIYAAGDIFVFPSEYDAFGTACLEAMASGLPVIVSKTSGASEIVTHGEDGFIVNHPIDAHDIAKYLQTLLEKGMREQMGAVARQKAERYSFQANIEKTLLVYRKVVACCVHRNA